MGSWLSKHVKGYSGKLDINCFYGDVAAWNKIAGITTPDKPKEEPKKEEPKKEEPKKTEPKKTVDKLAQEVIDGKWGTGENRNSKLRKAGYNNFDVQKRVNKYYEVAKDVIRGNYGNGAKRTEKLKKAGYNPATIQKIVNNKL